MIFMSLYNLLTKSIRNLREWKDIWLVCIQRHVKKEEGKKNIHTPLYCSFVYYSSTYHILNSTLSITFYFVLLTMFRT